MGIPSRDPLAVHRADARRWVWRVDPAAALHQRHEPAVSLGWSSSLELQRGRRIDLDFKDFDIHNILRMISDVGQVNIITSDDVKGSITIRMRDVPWDQALDVILKAKSLGMQREGNLIRVAPLAVLEKELEAELARAKASIELKPLDTRLIPLSYATGDKMLPRVAELLSSRGKVSVDERTNMLIVSDVASNIALAEDLIRNLDTQTPQVLIEARIVEASQNFTRQVGIQWGGNTLNSAATGNPTGPVVPVHGRRRRAVRRPGRSRVFRVGSSIRTTSSTCLPRRAVARVARSASRSARCPARTTSTCGSPRSRARARCASCRRRRS